MANSPEDVWVVSYTMSEKQIEETAKEYHSTVEQVRQAATTLYAVFTQRASAERYAEQKMIEGYTNVHWQAAPFHAKRWFPKAEGK